MKQGDDSLLMGGYRPFVLIAGMLLLAIAAGLAAAHLDERRLADRRLQLLQIDAQRKSLEIMASTLNGKLMGAISMLGLTDPEIEQEAATHDFVDNPSILTRLDAVGHAFGANGVFVVGQDGWVKSMWDGKAKPSTGLDVAFRPYFRTAMSGRSNVYAAVSVSQDTRVLYFAAPVNDPAQHLAGGAVVARTDLASLDSLLRGEFDKSMLLSPQGVVFASNQREWIGNLAGEASPERLAAIRGLKQFGNLFEQRDPKVLPFAVTRGIQMLGGHRHVVASAEVDWNDPSGPWTVVLMEDLDASAPVSRLLLIGGLVAALALLLEWMALRLWEGQRRQRQANAQLRQFADQQEAMAVFRAELSRVAAHLQRCEHLPALASAFLLDARGLVGAMQGSVYVATIGQDRHLQRLILAGSSAAASELPQTLALGEGLLGQCALDRRRLLLETPPQGPWLLRSGLGQVLPGALLLAPLILQDELVGIVELALLRRPDAVAQARLDDLLPLLTNSLEILRRNAQAWQPLQQAQMTDDIALEVSP